MGYNFIVSSVNAAMSQTPDMVDVDVTVTQIGVAPFYYPLSLVLDCSDLTWPRVYEGVEEIISEGESKLFSFVGISATPDCLGNVSLYLSCPTAYTERPIKFAQGTDGRVSLSIPMPETKSLTDSPTKMPAPPTNSPMTSNLSLSILLPFTKPLTDSPTEMPAPPTNSQMTSNQNVQHARTSTTACGSTRIVVSVAAVMVVLCLMLAAAAIVVARRRKKGFRWNRAEKSTSGKSEETYNEDLDLDTVPQTPVVKRLRTLPTFEI
jgi:hypothetical protein